MLGIILGIIIIAAIYILVNSYIKESGISTIILLFLFIIGFGIYILIGLQITKDIESLSLTAIYWIAYTIFVITIINVFLIGYFWSVVRKKTGPYGMKGPIGDTGLVGNPGTCTLNSSQSFAIKGILQQLDKLFQEKQNSSLLKNNNEPINDYLNDKISSIITSNQYKITLDYMTSEKIPLENLFTYITNIFTIWFNLIYNASDGEWFLDQYADENYEFKTQNPFDEIKKYDLYYWGMIDSFRRLNVEICSDNIDTPMSDKEPRLRIIKSNDYEWNWYDRHSDAERDVITWKLKNVEKNGEVYYPLGVTATNGDGYNGDYLDNYYVYPKDTTTVDGLEMKLNESNGPKLNSILVAGDVKPPVRFDSTGVYVGGDDRGWVWRPVAPSGYTCLGDFWGRWGAPDVNSVRCLPNDCVEEVPYNAPELGEYKYMGLWNQDDDWENYLLQMRTNTQTMEQNSYHLARLKKGGEMPKFYKIKDSCLKPTPPINNKELEEQYSKMAIGWNGNPVKSGAKYSIFSLLGLMPEGVITHINTGRRYYIIHYGGVEINRYLVLLPNHTTEKWDSAIEVSDDKNATTAKKAILVRNKIHQQWIIKKASNGKIILESYYNRKNLGINLIPSSGEENYFTSSALTIKNYFNFISSYGEKPIV